MSKKITQKEFKAIFRQGARLYYQGQKLFFLKNSLGINRLAVVVPKASVKLSTRRNRTRRLLKEAYRLKQYNITNSIDIIIRIYKPIANYAEAEKLLLNMFKKSKLIEDKSLK